MIETDLHRKRPLSKIEAMIALCANCPDLLKYEFLTGQMYSKHNIEILTGCETWGQNIKED